MSSTPFGNPETKPQTQLSEAETQQLFQTLRRKEGTWVDWGHACQALQKAGYSPQQIFEETGFEPVHQNQIVVASQVYGAIANADTSEAVQSHFQQRGSDLLYEFRILTQPERAAAATLAFEKGIDAEQAHEVAKAIKAYSRLSSPPEGFASFSDYPGDAIAHYYWKLARQQSDLQDRSRLIAQGLRFAATNSARRAIESLLTDFTVVKARSAPLMPIYRLDSEEELPRIIPVAGWLPLKTEDFKSVPLVEEEGSFRMVKFSGAGAWVPLPGWQVVLLAEDPVVLLTHSDALPIETSERSEEILVLVNRAQRQWNPDSYFVVDVDGQLQIQWNDESPSAPLMGRVVLLLKPKKILDENLFKDPWQIEE